MGKISRKKSKVSGVKLTNKKTTKLAKRGQLDHQKKRRKEALKTKQQAKATKAENAARSVKSCGTESVIEDEGYYEKADVGFARSLLKDGESRRKKNRKADDDVEALFSSNKRAKQWLSEDSKPLLPIKEKNKLIERSQKIEKPFFQADEPLDDDHVMQEEDTPTPLPELSVIELHVQRVNKLRQRKAVIASMSCAIIENPEENMKKLRALREFWNESDLDIRSGSRRLVLLSLTEIYKDILPDYNIRVATQSEKQQASGKDTKQLRQFEENLLFNYKLYLQILEECIGKSADKKLREKEDTNTKVFRLLAVKCMCQVFVKRPTFNFSKNIVNVLIPLLAVHNQAIITPICAAVEQIFKDDKKGEISLDIVRCICRTVKTRNFNVDPMALKTFLALRIKEINTEEDRQKKLTHKEKMKQWSRKERKLDKRKKELNKQLEDAALEVNKTKILQARTDTISAIFTLYFMILKKAQGSVLLSSVLAGLAKFAHLINVDFFDDLFRVFNEISQLDVLSLADTLNITETAFTILSGQGEALNIDPQHFYTHLYKVLPQLHTAEDSDLISKVEGLMKLMFFDRKKKVTNARVLAYTKRLVRISIHMPPESALILLTSARKMFTTFPCTDVLLDVENVGSGVYRPDIDEPEYCNAHNTMVLYELHLLMLHTDEAVKQCAKLMLKASPEHDKESKMRCNFCQQTPEDLINCLQEQENVNRKTSGKANRNKKEEGSTDLRKHYIKKS
ncbi:nucleolar complex protein 3 homolog [Watersipora subatra]|uniref:nucleolar complex protein 3 homolog n=1 Tax=Watersipora subatra TaxID=2589382 RepID=UPI00355B7DB5